MLPCLQFLVKVIEVMRRCDPAAGQDVLGDLHPAERLREILERERARADRTGGKLSLLAFTAPCQEPERAATVYLVKTLKSRLRLTDEVGWLEDGQRVGVVLPGASAAGAWTVVDDVCLRFPEEIPPPVCTVYTYPSKGQAREKLTCPVADTEQGPARGVVGLEILFVRPLPLWKRLLDVVGATAGLVLLLPVLAIIAAAIKVSSPGPIIFRQRRSGLGGKPFFMYKFRSMVADAELRKKELQCLNERDGPAFKIMNDPRITPLGRILRSTSLDELPQLWNVLRGDMSLVGPRPLPCHESEACAGWQWQRLDVTPGLTCIWQVSGRHGVSFTEWMRMDLRYIRSRSLGQDLKLLVMTVGAVLSTRGAH